MMFQECIVFSDFNNCFILVWEGSEVHSITRSLLVLKCWQESKKFECDYRYSRWFLYVLDKPVLQRVSALWSRGSVRQSLKILHLS